MTSPHLYEQTDFASETETLDEWRHRVFPAPTRRARAAIWLPGIGLAISFVAVLDALRILIVSGP